MCKYISAFFFLFCSYFPTPFIVFSLLPEIYFGKALLLLGIQAQTHSLPTHECRHQTKKKYKNRNELYFHRGAYRCQGVCRWASSPGLPSPAGLGEKPSSGDLAGPRPARGSCWTGGSEWWRREWADCLALGCCSPPSPWSQYCCRWHHQTAWCPSSPPRRTAKHLRWAEESDGKRGGGGEKKGEGIMERCADMKLTIFKVINTPRCSGTLY